MSRIQDALLRAAEKYDSDNPDDQGRVYQQLEHNQHSEIIIMPEKVDTTVPKTNKGE